ncbi:M15 family metallopeptidase [Gordonia sp. ABSL1-1]|uniref:M15 family metallopeptidase n=1 Tax=Gordonia sp. ABSL1-1 TaxID=3053923 RepID=UPI0025733751|nr:M15 family metallopeptidase [Gordonia sp. ABSL1-1]MDL9935952.1 M15 family metallopeptidase [Gordonia sp. ABSL1-1]
MPMSRTAPQHRPVPVPRIMSRSRSSYCRRTAILLSGLALLGGVFIGTGTASGAAPTAGLDPVLAHAYTRAAAAAHDQGVGLHITSGKRSRAEQQRLWRDALATYGSPAAARRWVLPPAESTHVSGHAIDVGPRAGASWLQRNGFRWGLCRTFANEWWHFEVVTLPGLPCPAMWPDAATRADAIPGLGLR